jgi:uroporphyrinogen-III synthase
MAEQLRAAGHEALVEPLLLLEDGGTVVIQLAEAQAIVVTSARALASLQRRPGALSVGRNLPLYAVGGASAAKARALGFSRVVEGPGTAAGLADLLAAQLDPKAGRLLHPIGADVAFDLAGNLRNRGFRVDAPIVYRMTPARALSTVAIDALLAGSLDGVILLSPRTAATYARLVAVRKLEVSVQRLLHYCLSEAVATALAPLGNVALRIPDRPSTEELLELIGQPPRQSEG